MDNQLEEKNGNSINHIGTGRQILDGDSPLLRAKRIFRKISILFSLLA